MNSRHPDTLKMQCATAVRFASLFCPMLAKSAVIVVPILSPRRIGIAPVNPNILVTPSGPAWAAKFCNTAIVALLLCTTRVINVPTKTPSTGIFDTFAIKSVNTGLDASGFITSPIVSIPRNNRPKANIVCPILFTFSDFATKEMIKPINMIM